MPEQPSAVAKRQRSGKSKNLRFLVGYGAKPHVVFRQSSAVAKRQRSGKSKNLRFLAGYGAKPLVVFRQPSAVAKRKRSGGCRELSSLLGFGAKPQKTSPNHLAQPFSPIVPLTIFLPCDMIIGLKKSRSAFSRIG